MTNSGLVRSTKLERPLPTWTWILKLQNGCKPRILNDPVASVVASSVRPVQLSTPEAITLTFSTGSLFTVVTLPKALNATRLPLNRKKVKTCNLEIDKTYVRITLIDSPSLTSIIFEDGSNLYSFIMGLKKYSLALSEWKVIFPFESVWRFFL